MINSQQRSGAKAPLQGQNLFGGGGGDDVIELDTPAINSNQKKTIQIGFGGSDRNSGDGDGEKSAKRQKIDMSGFRNIKKSESGRESVNSGAGWRALGDSGNSNATASKKPTGPLEPGRQHTPGYDAYGRQISDTVAFTALKNLN